MSDPASDIALLDSAKILALMARAEDLGDHGDITSSLLDDDGPAEFRLLAKQSGVFAGRRIAGDVLAVFGGPVLLDWTDSGRDGAVLRAVPVELAVLRGQKRAVLSAERTLLNFLQRLSGIATATRRYVDAVAGTAAKIFDTRKTTPGWRILEKYAVRCGGGHNHRMGLYDAVLIKDNHLASTPPDHLASAVFQMLNVADSLKPPPAFVEVEADTLEQLEALLNVVGIDVILLDNFSLEDLRAAVKLRDDLNLHGKVELEASGGITLDTARAIAHTGVERISVGAITHSAPALDLSLERA